MDGSILDLHTVEFKRLIPGPIELAWDYLTKQELLKTWFADMTVEPRVGGAVVIRFSEEESCSTTGVRGTVSEFRPQRRRLFLAAAAPAAGRLAHGRR